MKGKKYKTEEKIQTLREEGQGGSIIEVCREYNISEVHFLLCERAGFWNWGDALVTQHGQNSQQFYYLMSIFQNEDEFVHAKNWPSEENKVRPRLLPV